MPKLRPSAEDIVVLLKERMSSDYRWQIPQEVGEFHDNNVLLSI